LPPPGEASARRVRVILADDHPLLREGVERAIAAYPSLELVGVASDGREALEEIRRLEPDVAVVDLRMPGLGGMEVVHAVSRDGLSTRVMFLSGYVDSAVAYRALAEGAMGFITKEAGGKAVCEAIAAVARGEIVLSPEAQSSVAEEIRVRRDASEPALTPREREVLRFVAEGLSAPDIAERLSLSAATVKGHLGSIYEKLGVSERAAAVAEGMRRGLLE
jgi:two-component system, NarL family, nitrate/nitrite response regulator NarL